MSEESAPVRRLGKVAREFNVGVQTIIEYLQKKGHKVDSNPNAKVSDEVYAVLCTEFQQEKNVKEKS
ncbi:MAG: hypothetical protein V2A54_16595, partial [Bacteroidota bacterium]